VATTRNVAVTMSDGTVLRADVYFPVDRRTGAAAAGPFPVILTQTPYGKSSATVTGFASGLAGAATGLVQRGYLDVVADVRGTGDSHGTWDLFAPVQAQDGAELVRWAARLPHADGRVGLLGGSYLGINQLLTAAAVGPHSPLKAIFPIIAGNDLYRDIAYFGGALGEEFDALFLGLTMGLHTAMPVISTTGVSRDDLADLASVEADHAGTLASFDAATVLDSQLEGPFAYDEAYWQARNPRNVLRRVVDNGVPAFLVGGWYDLFQRGEPLNFSGLQNAYFHRPVGAPMPPGAAVTARYQLLMGPWYHVTAGTGIDMTRLELQWFDHWLKGRDTGITKTSTPLHVEDLATGRYFDTARYPFDSTQPARWYLQAANGLSPRKPSGGSDPIAFVPATSPCDRQTEQWGAGFGALAFGASEPCARDDRTLGLGPGAVQYTTAPFTHDMVLAGPVGATLYATSTRPETFLDVTLEDVAPDGASSSLTSGGLVGSFRAVDGAQSWIAEDGSLLVPYHPYTKASQVPVPTGKVTRFDLEVFPTFTRLATGHRLRATITTNDSPHVGFTPAQLANLVGGTYAIEHNPTAASYLTLPLAPASAYTRACDLCRAAP
jgi:putative CocE/NonD family hydrolase